MAYDTQDYYRAEYENVKPGHAGGVNVAGLQRALDNAGLISLTTPGTYTLNGPLTLYSNTTFHVGAGVTLRLATNSNCNIVTNESASGSAATVTITSSGSTATVSWAAHGKSAGDWIAIHGAEQGAYNGVWEVASAPTANNLTYVCDEVPSASPATGTIYALAADHDIRLIVDGTLDYNGANQSVSGTNNTHLALFAHVARLHLEGRFVNAKKYAILAANTRDFTTGTMHFDTISDGLHLQGPARHPAIGTLHGTTGDDMLAFTLGDFSTYEITRGDVTGATVAAIKPARSLTALKIAGNANCKVHSLKVGSITGSTGHQAVFVTNDTDLTQTDIGQLEIGEIRVANDQDGDGTWPICSFKGTSYESVVVRNLTKVNAIVKDSILFDGCTVGRALIEGLYDHTAAAVYQVNVQTTGTTINQLDCVGWDVTPPNSATTAFVNMGASTTITDLRFSRCRSVAGASGRWVRHGAGTLTRIHYNQCFLSGGNSFYDQTTGSLAAPEIWFADSTGDGFATGFNFRNTATLHLSNAKFVNFTNRPVQTANGTYTVEVYGSCAPLASRLINKGTGVTVYASGPTLYCDVATHQDARTGDMVRDTGSGKVVHCTDGANFTAVN